MCPIKKTGLGLLLVLHFVGCDSGGGGQDDQADSEAEKVCVPQSRTCQENSLYECDEAGSGWLPIAYCSLGCQEGACVNEACSSDCAGKVCGPDGCGGTCGTCPAGTACSSAGTCTQEYNCGEVTNSGQCDGNQLSYCDNGQLVEVDCEKCGFDFYSMLFDCLGCNQFWTCFNDDMVGFDPSQSACEGTKAIADTVISCDTSYPCHPLDTEFCGTFAQWYSSCKNELAAHGTGAGGWALIVASVADKVLAKCE
jgi:hypothetical protein